METEPQTVTPLVGKFLVASPSLTEPTFARSVIFLLQHSENGSLGLIVNRPLDVSVGEAVVEEVAAAASVSDPLHLGGPCTGPLTVLHDGSLTDDDGQTIGQCLSSGVCLTSDRLDIERLLERDAGVGPRKFIVGYSGWGPGQLDGELEEGSWTVADGDVRQVLESGADLWTRVVGRLHVAQYVPEDRIPPDPSRN